MGKQFKTKEELSTWIRNKNEELYPWDEQADGWHIYPCPATDEEIINALIAEGYTDLDNLVESGEAYDIGGHTNNGWEYRHETTEHNYRVKEMLVRTGKSKIFKDWNSKVGIEINEFLDGLNWVCKDPEIDYEDGRKRMTRELGCTTDGKLVKLKRVNSRSGDFVGLYNIETNLLWNGNVSINCRNRV